MLYFREMKNKLAVIIALVLFALGFVSMAEEKPEKPSRLLERDRPKFENLIDLGVDGSEGDEQEFDFRAGLVSQYRDEKFRIKLNAAYFYGTKEDIIDENDYYIELINEYYFSDSRWLAFIAGRYDWQMEGSWLTSETYYAGVGNKILDREKIEAYLRTGFGYTREYQSERIDFRPVAVISGELDWRISEDQRLTADSTYYYLLDGSNEYRVESKADFTFRIHGAEGVNLKMGIQNEYESKVEEGFKYNDLNYYAAIAIRF